MQAKNFDGTFGKVMPFAQEGMKELLEKETTEHVEVFEATEETLKYRNRLYKPKKRFQKTGNNKKR